ncbi:MAG: transcription elongation factor GreB [Nitrospinota bacterium]|nr:transcription elongation factor GreB [Nitrospinota bacterium]
MPSYITPQGYRKLVAEFDRLLKEERPMVTREVAYAASLGDRSENAEYIYGKKRLRSIDKRLRYLKRRLDSIEVVDPEGMSGTTVRFGATVTVEDEIGQEQVYMIVGEDEVDIDSGHLSYKSPIGNALVGKEEGDAVRVKTPRGQRELAIISVEWIPGGAL